MLDSWAQAVGRQRLKVISFDLSARAGTILQDFVAAACPTIARDLAEGAFADSTAFNESLPADLLEFKRIANLWGEVGLADWLEEALRAGYAGPRFGVNAEEADEWRAIYEPSNQRIAREYFAASKASDIFPVTEARDRGTVLEGQLGAETLAKLFAFAWMREQNRFKEAEARMKALELQVASIRARLGENL